MERRRRSNFADNHRRTVGRRAAVFVLDLALDVPGAVVGRRAARSRRWAQSTEAGAVPAVEGVGEPGGHVHRRRVVRTGEGEADGAAFVDGGRRREYRGGRHVAYGDRGRPLGRSAIFVGDLPLDHIGALVIECAHRRR